MVFYILVGLLLSVATMASAQRQTSFWSPFCLVILIIFIGLRYQLGYDWLGYERLFDFVPDNFDFSQYSLSWNILRTEPLFYALNIVVKSLGCSFEMLLFILALFNIIVIDRMCQQIMPGSQPFVWLVYFCAAMIAVQFNIIRQAAASSLVILSFLFILKRRIKWAISLFVAAAFVQVSIAMLAPIFLLRLIRPRLSYFIGIVGIGVALLASGIFIGAGAVSTAGSLLPDFIGSKADNYVDAFATRGALSTVSPLALALVVLYGFMLLEFMRFKDDPPVRIAIYLTVLVLFAHTGLGAFPSVWNRIMCVSLPWQLACLWRTGFFQAMSPGRRSAALASVATAGLAVMSYQLTRPESVPFVPYHSLLQVWAFGDEGDGRARAEDTIRMANAVH